MPGFNRRPWDVKANFFTTVPRSTNRANKGLSEIYDSGKGPFAIYYILH